VAASDEQEVDSDKAGGSRFVIVHEVNRAKKGKA
jgi:hypothetical protein